MQGFVQAVGFPKPCLGCPCADCLGEPCCSMVPLRVPLRATLRDPSKGSLKGSLKGSIRDLLGDYKGIYKGGSGTTMVSLIYVPGNVACLGLRYCLRLGSRVYGLEGTHPLHGSVTF